MILTILWVLVLKSGINKTINKGGEAVLGLVKGWNNVSNFYPTHPAEPQCFLTDPHNPLSSPLTRVHIKMPAEWEDVSLDSRSKSIWFSK